jgi:hypothetical protein
MSPLAKFVEEKHPLSALTAKLSLIAKDVLAVELVF